MRLHEIAEDRKVGIGAALATFKHPKTGEVLTLHLHSRAKQGYETRDENGGQYHSMPNGGDLQGAIRAVEGNGFEQVH